MLNLTSLNVGPYAPTGITLTWEYTLLSGNASSYSFDIYRSESPGYPDLLIDYEIIASGINPDVSTYTDQSVIGLFSHGRIWYYKILITDITSGDTSIQPSFPSSRLITNDDISTNEILYRKSLSLTRTGRTLHVLKRRTWGTHCSRCWDQITFKTGDPDCPVCYGTGWINGYFSPIEFKGMINSSPQFNQIQMFGEWKPSDNMLIMLDWPTMMPKDIIVDDTDKRWVVAQTRTVEKLGRHIEQSCQLQLIAADDIAYKFPITNNTFQISPTSLRFNAYKFGTLPDSQVIHLTNTIEQTQNYIAESKTNWLNILSTSSGINTGTLEIQPSSTSLSVGLYTGSILINTNQYINVTYSVKTPPEIISNEYALTMSGISSQGILPSGQTFAISTKDPNDLTSAVFSISTSGTWYDMSYPVSGNYNIYHIQPNTLISGLYEDIIYINLSGASNTPYEIYLRYEVT